LRITLDQQLLHLRVLEGFGHRRWHEPGLLAARLALVFGVPALRAVAPDIGAATASAQMLGKNHVLSYNFTL